MSDYRITEYFGDVYSFNKSVNIQEISKDRWVAFVLASNVERLYVPVGPVHSSRTKACEYVERELNEIQRKKI